MDSKPQDDSPASLPRSPELMNARDTALLVVDMQEGLLSVIPDRFHLVWNARRLLDAADALGVRTAATEQYPAKLSPTVAELAERLGPPEKKMSFSCGACGGIFERWREEGVSRVLVCGIETHVCVQQTALDLAADGFLVYVAVDAVAARREVDHQTALRRMETAGVILTSTEAAMFEWCETAETPQFKRISALAKESPPG